MRARNRYSKTKIMTLKTTTRETFGFDVVWICVIVFHKLFITLFPFLGTFHLSSFFLSITLINFASS